MALILKSLDCINCYYNDSVFAPARSLLFYGKFIINDANVFGFVEVSINFEGDVQFPLVLTVIFLYEPLDTFSFDLILAKSLNYLRASRSFWMMSSYSSRSASSNACRSSLTLLHMFFSLKRNCLSRANLR